MDPRSTEKLGTIPNVKTASGVSMYLAVFALASALLVSAFGVWGLKGRDHFGSFSRNGDADFYRDFAGRRVSERLTRN
jgi:hypothetical protein